MQKHEKEILWETHAASQIERFSCYVVYENLALTLDISGTHRIHCVHDN